MSQSHHLRVHVLSRLLVPLFLLLLISIPLRPLRPPFFLVRSPSLPFGFYLPARSPIRAGTLVAVCLPARPAARALHLGYLPPGACPSGVAPIGKVVLAVAGDVVELSPAGLRFDGHLLPGSGALAFDSRGRLMPHAPFGRYRLGQHQVWLYSPYHPRSLDSRYYGPLPERAILTAMRPLLIDTRGLPQPRGFRLRIGRPEVS